MPAYYQETRTYQYSMNSFIEELRSQQFCLSLGFDLKSENPMPSGIWYKFHSGSYIAPHGENIAVTLNSLDDNSVQVIVHSECADPNKTEDWGKNGSNVETIFNYLESVLKNKAPKTEDMVNGKEQTEPIDQESLYTDNNSSQGSKFSNSDSFGGSAYFNNSGSFGNNGYNSYNYSGHEQQPPKQEEKQPCKGLAIASMILGFIAFMCYGYFTGILSIIFAIVAKACGNKSKMATTGLICSIIAIAFWTTIFVIIGVVGSFS